MTTITLNNKTFEVVNFNRNTQFNGEAVLDHGHCNIKYQENISQDVRNLATETITSMVFHNDSSLLYDFGTINCKITSIDETLMGEQMSINLNFEFN